MRNRILAAVVAAFALIGVGFGAASFASASGPVNKLCAKVNSRELTVFSNTCPAGHFPVQIAGSDIYGGAAAVKGDKGDPGTNAIKIVHKTVVLNSNSPASQTVTLTGLPAKTASGLPELRGSNSGDAPSGVSVSVSWSSVTTGSTERSLTLSTTPLTAAQIFTVDLWVLAVTP
jgi:hypothetical protein